MSRRGILGFSTNNSSTRSHHRLVFEILPNKDPQIVRMIPTLSEGKTSFPASFFSQEKDVRHTVVPAADRPHYFSTQRPQSQWLTLNNPSLRPLINLSPHWGGFCHVERPSIEWHRAVYEWNRSAVETLQFNQGLKHKALKGCDILILK